MRKKISFVLLLTVLLGCLTACSFSTTTTSSLPGNAEKTEQVEEMLAALAEGRTADAKALMHPQAVEKADGAIEQLSGYLAGRTVTELTVQSANVKTSTGTSGKMRQEQVVYQATLTDGEVVYFNAVYLTNKAGDGFISYQMILGIV